MDVSALKTGIYSEYSANSTLVSALTGGLHWRRAPQDPTYPYAVYFIVANHPEYTFTEVSENPLIQFSIFDYDENQPDNDTTINDCAKKLMACFDLCALTVSGYTHVVMMREMDREVPEPDGVLHYSADYRVRVQKSR